MNWTACTGVRRRRLFESAAREKQSAGSDFRFFVEFDAKSFDGHMDLKAFQEGLLGRPADLGTLRGISQGRLPALEQQIQKMLGA